LAEFDDEQLEWIRTFRDTHPSPVTLGELFAQLRLARMAPPSGLAGLRRAVEAMQWFDGWVQRQSSGDTPAGGSVDSSPAVEGGISSAESPAQGDVALAPGAAARRREVRTLSEQDAAQIVETSRSSGMIRPLVELWLAARTPLDKLGRDALEDVDDDTLAAAAIELLRDLLDPHGLDADPGVALKRLGRWFKTGCPSSLRRFILNSLTDLPSGVPPDWMEDGLALAVQLPIVDAADAIASMERRVVSAMLDAAGGLPMKSGSARDRLYRAVFASDHWELLAQPERWRSIDLPTIGDYTRPTSPDRDLLAFLSAEVVQPAVSKRARSMRLAELFAFVAQFPHLAPFVDPRQINEAAKRSDPGAALFNDATAMIRSEAETKVAEAHADAMAARNEAAAMDASRASESARANELQQEVEQLQRRLERLASSQTSAHQAELRQAQIDAIKALVSIVDELRNVAALGGEHADVVAHLLEDGLRALRGFGVVTVGAPGDRRAPDPVIDGSGASGVAEVEVLSPAYVIELPDGGVTPLRHAVTRPLIT
jgi:hypothetical protein